MFGWGKQGSKTPVPEPARPTNRIPTVQFDSTRVTTTVLADLAENIRALGEVGTENFEMIYQAASHAISVGGALNVIYATLMGIDGMTKKRANEISLSLNAKANAVMKAEQQTKLGVKYATWRYSGAPCWMDSNQPGGTEQDAAHKAANGQHFLISKGMLVNGDWTWPGRKDGCKCRSKPLIPGFDGYDGSKPKWLGE